MKRLAAFSLETKEDDLEFGVGQQGPEIKAKSTGKSINYWGLANIVNVNSALLSPELYDVTLNCRYVWRAPFKVPDQTTKYRSLTLTYASQLHIAVIEVDRETFVPKILDYVAVDDCGTVINPSIVEGQVYGATAHGIGAALMETCVYDAVGNMLTSTFSNYTPITSVNIPKIKYGHTTTPSPHSYSGAKGMGEGGAAGCIVCPGHLYQRFIQQRRQHLPFAQAPRRRTKGAVSKAGKERNHVGTAALGCPPGAARKVLQRKNRRSRS